MTRKRSYPIISRVYYLITIYDNEKQKSSHELFTCVHEETSQSLIQVNLYHATSQKPWPN